MRFPETWSSTLLQCSRWNIADDNLDWLTDWCHSMSDVWGRPRLVCTVFIRRVSWTGCGYLGLTWSRGDHIISGVLVRQVWVEPQCCGLVCGLTVDWLTTVVLWRLSNVALALPETAQVEEADAGVLLHWIIVSSMCQWHTEVEVVNNGSRRHW